jgi:hypothetical protein
MNLTDYKLTFGGAGQQQIHARGRFIRIREATGDVYLSVNGAGEIKRTKGEQIDLGFDAQIVNVRSAVAQVVELTASPNKQDDNRNAVSVTTTTTVDPSNNINGVAAATCPSAGSVKLVSANGDRVRLIVKVPSDQPDGVWLAGAGSSANNGDFLEPGERLILGTTAELWAYGNGNGDVLVSVAEEEIL